MRAITPFPEGTPEWARKLYKQAKAGAASRKLPFTITPHHMHKLVEANAGYCEVSGIHFELERVFAVGNRNPFAPSLDRIDSNYGYVPGNVRLVCVAVNLALSNWGDDVLLQIARGMVRVAFRANKVRQRRERAIPVPKGRRHFIPVPKDCTPKTNAPALRLVRGH